MRPRAPSKSEITDAVREGVEEGFAEITGTHHLPLPPVAAVPVIASERVRKVVGHELNARSAERFWKIANPVIVGIIMAVLGFAAAALHR